MGSNKYIITKIKWWPVFKQDPYFFNQSAGSAVAALENDLTEKREEKEALTGRRMREIGRLKEQRDRLDREGREVVARIR